MHAAFHGEDVRLHLRHERHDLRVVGFGGRERVDLGVLGQVSEILQQVEREAFALQRALAEFTDERLPVALLPDQVGGLAHPLCERRHMFRGHGGDVE